MNMPLSAVQVFEQDFLPLRCKMLEIAAMLDRLDRADGSIAKDSRMAWIKKGLETLQSADPDRARRLQLIFSQPYDDGWLERFTPSR